MPVEISHTIIAVAYNQEKYISSALDSVLHGPRRADEIIIIDDCSTDTTFKIIQYYKKKYPSIMKIIRNDKNLGVTENLNKLFNIPVKGNVVSILAGDDYYDKSLLFEMDKIILSSNLNPNNDKFMLLPNVANVFPDESIQLLDNSLITKKFKVSPFQIALRSKMYTQQVGNSIALYNKWSHYPKNSMEKIGIYADLIQFLKNVHQCNLFVPVYSSTVFHRVGIGVTSRRHKISPHKSRYLALKVISNELKGSLDFSDNLYIKFSMALDYFYASKSLLSLMQIFFYFPIAIFFDKVDKLHYLNSIKTLIKDTFNKLKKSFLYQINRNSHENKKFK